MNFINYFKIAFVFLFSHSTLYAESPFSVVLKKARGLNQPNTSKARYKAVEDLLGIRYFSFRLHSSPTTEVYTISLEIPSSKDEEKVIKKYL